MLIEAAIGVGPASLPADIRAALGELGIQTSDGVGDAPGGVGEAIRGDGRGRLDWRGLLRHYVGRLLETRPVFDRPPRRFPELIGILPGRRRQASRPRILAIIDTSGSMTAKLLEQIDAELGGLARKFSVTVAECDAEIQRVYPYRRLDQVLGRGGTDFRPPLQPSFLRQYRPDLVVLFTDGYGPAPESPPRVPVLWILTPGGVIPAPWGRVIRMDEVP